MKRTGKQMRQQMGLLCEQKEGMRRQKLKKEKAPLKIAKKKTASQRKKSKNVWQFYCLDCPACTQKILGIISYKMKSFLPISEKIDENKKTLTWPARNYYNISCGQKRQ